jgi:hypothetical protein
MREGVQVLNVEDKIAIGELVARFAHCSDYGDWVGLEALFTEDVVTEMEGIPLRYEGIVAQIAHARESDAQTAGKNRHYNFNLYVEEQNGEVVARYMFANVNAGSVPMKAQIVTSGTMRDTVRKTPEGWKIARRYVTFDQSFQLDF